jgi:parvulin-like peptidyl-prolyl isomerase
MHRRLLFLLVLALPGLFLAHAQSPRARPVDGFAAIVNGRVITVGDVIDSIRAPLEQLRRRNLSPREAAEAQRKLFDEGLERLIDQHLMVAKFTKLEASLPPGALRERTENILRERFNNNRAELLNTLRQVGKSEKEWEDELRDQIIVQSMTQQFVSRFIHVTPAELRSAFEARGDELKRPVELKLRSIAFRPATADEEAARKTLMTDVLTRVREGADFAETAREFSEGPTAEKGGDEGWVKPETLPAVLRDVLLTRSAGEITDLIPTPTQFYIFWIEDRRGGDTMSFAEAQPILETDLRRVQFDQRKSVFMESLRREFPVFRFDPSGALENADL